MGFNDLLREELLGPASEQQRQAFGRIEVSARRLLELIEAMLDFSRLETGKMVIDTVDVDPASILDAVRRDPPAEPGAGVRVRWEIPDTGLVVRTDPGKLEVVLRNVVGNAFKFTSSGEVCVGLRSLPEGVEYFVRDTGVGIATDVRPYIFEAFRQGDGSATRAHEGAGLGLYIARRLLDALGGEIDFESRPEAGSTFFIRLPSRRAATMTGAALSDPPTMGAENAGAV
jgi:signal transduction histidine kinase